MERVPSQRAPRSLAILLAASAVFAASAILAPALSAQTIRGRLLDSQSGQPIDLGILTLFTAEGDSVGFTLSNPDGGFSITSPEPGSFLLSASAWGYRDKQEGVFELGEGGRVDIEFRIAPLALLLEEILVPIDGPITNEHRLIRNGFVRRFQQGFGHFITPRDLERTVYRDTESLFYFIPGVRVVWSKSSYAEGEHVVINGPWGWCTPTVYIDGIRSQYEPRSGLTLSLMAPVGWIEAVEVYRRPSEIPPQYHSAESDCGVILLWLKR